MSTYRRKSPQQLRKSPSRSKSPQQLRKSPSRRKSPQQLRKSPQQFGNRVGANIWQGMGRKYAQEPEDVLSRSIGKTTISTEADPRTGVSKLVFTQPISPRSQHRERTRKFKRQLSNFKALPRLDLSPQRVRAKNASPPRRPSTVSHYPSSSSTSGSPLPVLKSSFENASFFEATRNVLSRAGMRSRPRISTADNIVVAAKADPRNNKYGSHVDKRHHTGKIGRIVNGLSDVTVATNLRNKMLNFNGVLMGDSRAQQLATDIRVHISRICRQEARGNAALVKAPSTRRKRRPPTSRQRLQQDLEPVRVLILKHNRLRAPGVKALLAQILTGYDSFAKASVPIQRVMILSFLDLSCNQIGKGGVGALCEYLSTSHGHFLHHLNLEDNKLGEVNVVTLSEALIKNRKHLQLRTLNLSKNLLSVRAATTLADLLAGGEVDEDGNDTEPCNLAELTLSWNSIHSVGAAALCNGLLYNSKLRVLDLSWNSFGSTGAGSSFGQQAVKALSEMVIMNQSITHLDISHNGLGVEDCEMLGDALAENSTILGMHVEGNASSIDPAGFVEPKNCRDPTTAHVFSRMMSPNVKDAEDWKYTSNCWICERWREVRYEFTPGVSGKCDGETPVFVLPSFDKWIPDKMDIEPVSFNGIYGNGIRELYRMAPPGIHQYVFLVGEDHVTTAEDFLIKPTPKPVWLPAEAPPTFEYDKDTITEANVLDVRIGLGESCKPGDDNNLRDLQPSYTLCDGYEAAEAVNEALGGMGGYPTLAGHSVNEFIKNIRVKPRNPRARLQARQEVWELAKSVFSHYKQDTPSLLRKSFWKDYQYTNIDRFVKDPTELEEIKKMLMDNYGSLKALFKQYSATGTESSDVFSMGLLSFTDLCQNCGALPKLLNLADMDNIFIATNSSSKKAPTNENNPQKALARFQMLEVVGRMALQMKNRADSDSKLTIANHLEILLTQHVRPLAKQFDPKPWRNERLHNEACDTVIKKHLEELKLIYVWYTGRSDFTGKKKSKASYDTHNDRSAMSLDDFTLLLNEAHVVEDENTAGSEADFAVREVRLAFTRSVMTTPDELLLKSTHKSLTFVEFFEAISRVADMKSASFPEDHLMGYRLFDGKGMPPTFNDDEESTAPMVKLQGSDSSIHLCFKLNLLLHGLVKIIRRMDRLKVGKSKHIAKQFYDSSTYTKPLRRSAAALAAVAKKAGQAALMLKSFRQDKKH